MADLSDCSQIPDTPEDLAELASKLAELGAPLTAAAIVERIKALGYECNCTVKEGIHLSTCPIGQAQDRVAWATYKKTCETPSDLMKILENGFSPVGNGGTHDVAEIRVLVRRHNERGQHVGYVEIMEKAIEAIEAEIARNRVGTARQAASASRDAVPQTRSRKKR